MHYLVQAQDEQGDQQGDQQGANFSGCRLSLWWYF